MKKNKVELDDMFNPLARFFVLIVLIVLAFLIMVIVSEHASEQNRITGNPVIIDGLEGDSITVDVSADSSDDSDTTSTSSESSISMQFMRFEEAKIPSDAIGVHTIFPSFMVKIDYDIKEYNDIIEDAKLFLEEVEECKKRIIYPDDDYYDPELIDPDAPESIDDCVTKKKPIGWIPMVPENHNYNYDVYVKETINGIPVKYRLALYFGEKNYKLEDVEFPSIEFVPSPDFVVLFSEYIPPGDGIVSGSFSDKKMKTPSGKQVYGVDVSHWQGKIEWELIAGTGRQFAFIKASEGTKFLDDKFTTNVYGASKQGMLVGAYHFARPDLNNGASEAKWFAFVLKKKYGNDYLASGYLKPVLDLERGQSMSTPQLTKWVHDFMTTFKQETGIEPIIYTNPSYIHYELDHTINKYKIWIAQWQVSQPKLNRDWDFWQYTSHGRLPGIGSERIDLNVFDGNLEELKAKFVI